MTRGRANSLRLAITGQLGPDALTSDEMAETLKLCVSCKGCRRECPTGVDMARMKIEVQAARAAKHGLSLHDRLVGYLPRYAPYAAKLPWLMNLRDVLPGAAKLSEAIAGFSARRTLPNWRRMCSTTVPGLRPRLRRSGGGCHSADARRREPAREVVLFADTFNRYFERENLDAALAVLHGRRLPRACRRSRRRLVAAAVLRPHVPLRRQGRRGAHGGASARSQRSRRSCARRSGGRPRAELPAELPRRGAGDAEGRRRASVWPNSA